MAYVKRAGVEAGNPQISGGGILGSGETQQKVGQSTANQSPTGFYNIQDFLKANQGQSQLASQVEQKAGEALAKQKSQFEQNKANISQVPQATEYTPDALQQKLKANEYDSLRKNMAQEYKPQTQEQIQGQLSQNVQNPFANMQAGNFKSIMDFFGQARPTGSQYTPGMQKQDEMLLRGKQGFAETMPQQYQNLYQEQVANPLSQLSAQEAERQKQAGESINKAGAQWQQSVKDWLAGQEQERTKAVADILAKQTETYQAGLNPDYKVLGSEKPYLHDAWSGAGVPGLQARFNQKMNVEIPGIGGYTEAEKPTEQTALLEYLKGQDAGANLEDYNAIQQLLGGQTVVNPEATGLKPFEQRTVSRTPYTIDVPLDSKGKPDEKKMKEEIDKLKGFQSFREFMGKNKINPFKGKGV